MLGTNDAYEIYWNEGDYKRDYKEMISNFIKLDSKPKVYLMIPPPVHANYYGL